MQVDQAQQLLEQLQATVTRLQPVAAQAMLAAFRAEMAAAVEAAVSTELSRLTRP